MRIVKLMLAAGLIAGSALSTGASAAINLVQNGSFEQFSYTYSSEIGPLTFTFNGNPAGGQALTGWTAPTTRQFSNGPRNALINYYQSANAATVSPASEYGSSKQQIAPSFTGASPDGGNFVGFDGDTDVNGLLQQNVSGLTVGHLYDLSFYFAGTQLQSASGPTTVALDANIGQDSFVTQTLSDPSQSFSGWFKKDFVFKAAATSELLSFTAVGSPHGAPPFALLDGVSITAVPEPATWAMMLVGFGGIGAFARRRRLLARAVA